MLDNVRPTCPWKEENFEENRSSNIEFGELLAEHFSTCMDKTRRLE
jgi:hypothetical protein